MTTLIINYLAVFIFGGMVGASLAIFVVAQCQRWAAADKRLRYKE